MREETIRFTSYEVTSSGNVRPSAILRRMQQIARDDLTAFGVSYQDLRDRNMAFVVSKMALVFHRPVPGEVDTVLTTAANEAHGATFPRSFVLRDEKGICMRAMSLWALLDFEKRSLLRASAFGVDLPTFPDLSEGVLCKRLFAPGDKTPLYSDSRRVYASMLDQNRHLNNCNYADLATDLLPEGAGDVKEIHLTYQHEICLGETLLLDGFSEDDGILIRGRNATEDRPVFLCHIKTF